jgi:putative two-component system response regulator
MMRDAAERASRQTILIVDDAPENLTLLYSLLKDKYRILAANSGERALQIVAGDVLPDLVLLDIMMPGVSGIDVCMQLKSNARTAGIPVMFLTAMGGNETEQAGFDAGAVDYIIKPISPPVVLARVRTHLKLKAAAVRQGRFFAARGGKAYA